MGGEQGYISHHVFKITLNFVEKIDGNMQN